MSPPRVHSRSFCPDAESTQSELLSRRQKAVPRGPFNVAPIFADRAEGAKLWDVDGREYIDFCGGIGARVDFDGLGRTWATTTPKSLRLSVSRPSASSTRASMW